MKLEEGVYRLLCESEALMERLSRYAGKPAVFYQSAPADTDPAWNGNNQYPRIDFTIDTQANPERHSSGQLAVHIWCDEAGAAPEELEQPVKNALGNVFLQPERQPPYCVAWARSEGYVAKDTRVADTQISGVSMYFDVFAFPCQETFDPDPIQTMNLFLSSWEPSITVIGSQRLPDFFVPNVKQPAVYFRLADYQRAEETNTVVWIHATIAGHIFSTDHHSATLLRYLTNELAVRGEVIMPDRSPMFLREIRVDSGSDALVTGQLRLMVRFGILRRQPYAHTLSIKPQIREE